MNWIFRNVIWLVLCTFGTCSPKSKLNSVPPKKDSLKPTAVH